MSASSIRAGRAFVEIAANDQPLQEALMKVRAKLNAFGAGLATIGGGLMAAAGGVAGSLAWPLQLAMNLEQSIAKFTTLLGSAEKATTMLAEIRAMAAATPFETTDLIAATETLLNFGVQSDEVLGILQQLGDASGGDAQRFSSLALVFGQVAANGKLMGGDLLQMVNAGFNPLNVIAKRTGETMSQLRDRMSAGEIGIDEVKQAFADATGPGGMFFGLMDAQSKTLAGRMSTLKDSFVEAVTPLGTALLPVIGAVINGVAGVVSVVGQWIEQNQQIAVYVAGAAAAMGALGAAMAGVGLGAIGLSKVSAVLAIIASPIGIILAGAGAVVGALWMWPQALTAIRSAAMSVLGFVGQALSAVGSVIGNVFSFVRSAISAVSSAVSAVITPLQSVGTAIQSIVAVVGQWVSSLSTVQSTASGLIDGLLQGFGAMGETFSQVWSGVSAAITNGNVEAAFAVATAGMGVLWEQMVGGLRQTWNDWTTALLDTWTNAVTAVSVIGVQIFQGIKSAWDTVVSGIVSAIDWLFAKLDYLQTLFSYIMASVKGDITEAENIAKGFQSRQAKRDEATANQNAAAQARRDGRDKETDQWIAQIRQIGEDEKRARQVTTSGLEDQLQRLADARSKLDQSIAAANEKIQAEETKLANKAVEATTGAKASANIIGMFNSTLANQQVGLKSSQDRLVKATEDSNKLLRDISKSVGKPIGIPVS